MRKLNLAVAAVALASTALVAGTTSAQGAHGYGGYGPTPAYAAGGGESYAPYDTYNRARPGFTLVGARAGVTVLGVNLDGGAGVRLSVGDDGYEGGHRHHHHSRPVAYAPPPPPPQYAPEPQYAPPPAYGYGGGYVTSYSYPTYPAPCGCAPYGW